MTEINDTIAAIENDPNKQKMAASVVHNAACRLALESGKARPDEPKTLSDAILKFLTLMS